MEIERTVSKKGQIVIPKDVRDYLGLKSGSEVIFEVKGKEVVLRTRISPKEFVEEFTNVGKKLRKLDMKRIKKTLEGEYAVR
ncbi:MAG: AbrB/MazE/SpoVT family DNA-binding domain-containing protein [Candidatus Micrarchaeota archaeon]|nr:AbrB/MazE/SpoVT family DNA-binding domain-containing protein [Candidatus Micrarchaeota archaeon]MDE1848175.1 AbrB/MazE/SpoVT family DNA-binding domain-containing protein [Candidatus Micrarchaeota archaeon]MDE1864656.1 AbrB/MazE/SpoVT family DNA-binding domain-containing protein [Candidatus Micrarchaeota archaeon]